MRPLITISIPTFNRAELLRLFLAPLLPRIPAFGGIIEVAVSDNCSSDNTSGVVGELQKICPFTYFRHPETVGAHKNIMFAATKLGTGEFCWLLGDDDYVLFDKLEMIISTIKANYNIDVFVVNFLGESRSTRDHIAREGLGSFSGTDRAVRFQISQDKIFSTSGTMIESILDNPAFITGIGEQIFRRSKWDNQKVAKAILRDEKIFKSLEHTFPHVVNMIHASQNSPIYVIADPCCVLSISETGRPDYIWNKIVINRIPELLLLCRDYGTSERSAERFLKNWAAEIVSLLAHRVDWQEGKFLFRCVADLLLQHPLLFGKYVAAPLLRYFAVGSINRLKRKSIFRNNRA